MTDEELRRSLEELRREVQEIGLILAIGLGTLITVIGLGIILRLDELIKLLQR